MAAKAEDIAQKFKDFKTARLPFDNLRQEIRNFLLPDKTDFNRVYGIGEKRRQNIFDGTGEHAIEIFAAGVVGIVANRATKWMRFKTEDDDLNKQPDVAEWLEKYSDLVLALLNQRTSKFYDRLYAAIVDIAGFGDGAMGLFRGTTSLYSFREVPVAGLYYSEDAEGNVDTVYLARNPTVLQLKQLQKEQNWVIPKTAAGKKDSDTLEVVHAIYPRQERIGAFGPESKAYASCYVLANEPQILKEEGYDQHPVPVGRWRTSGGEVYGRGLGEKALADVKTLQTMDMHHMMRMELLNFPPYQVPNKGVYGNIDLSAAAINYVDMNNGQRMEPLNSGGQAFPITVEYQRERREMIRNAFYVNIFQTAETDPNMTATEVQVRQFEKLRQSGVNIERIVNELVGPILDRAGAMVLRANLNGIMNNIPKALSGRTLKISYESILTRAQKLEEIQAIDSTVAWAANAAQVYPDVVDNYDFDKLAIERHEILGVPASGLRTPEERDAIREAKQQRAAEQEAMAMAQAGAKAAKDAAGAGIA